jgi:class 3 adenylate cyclase/tetratricopeptide (TPR) repeat protein
LRVGLASPPSTSYTPQVAACSACGTENPDGAKFCNECGAPLGAPPVARALEERKVVSVLFCDLVGFTAASERQDPEDVRARIRPYHARLRREIERYGGTVEKFVGDAVMAVFGAPAAHEDDAERAVRVSLRILQAIAELNEGDPGLGLQVRIGINTGEAVVSLGARPEQGEGIVTGDVVNTAARIQGVAPVDGIAVSEQTYRATSRFFDYEPLEPVSVKGKARPILLWRVVASRARLGADIIRTYQTPFVGRELEKALLIGTFERAAQQRSVQQVTLLGEPGVGKTRLIGELLSYVDAKPDLTRWRQGRCLPYGEGIAFWALGEIVKAEAGILESDSAEVAAAKLEMIVSPDEPDRQWLIERLAPLVGIEAPSLAEREELSTAWRRFLEGLAATNATVLVFEDLHWADQALLAFLEYLAEWSQGVPLLILCAARPELYERRPGWGAGQRNAQTIDLSPLSDDETAELVSHLTRTEGLEPGLERAIVERAEGNPLYAEEFVRLLADRRLEHGKASAEAAQPDSVQALIAARLDTLPPDRKALLQDAAVVGKVFWVGALREVGVLDSDEIEVALHELARKELVRPVRTSSMEGEREYSFWHLLVRDVAYSQIPRSERIRRHRATAGWIERKGGERVEDLAEVLAHHYRRALELADAVGDARQARELRGPARRFLALAGERALGLDTVQAESRLADALSLTSAEEPERCDLLIRWADALFQAGRSLEAAHALDDALDSLRGRDDPVVTARALQLRSLVAQRLGEGTQVQLAAEAVALLERKPPGPTLVAAYAQLANVQAIAGAYADAIAAADRAEAVAASLGLPEPARALGYRGYARFYMGDADGLAQMERTLALLLERGASRDAAILQNNLGVARYPLEGPARSLDAFEGAITFCEQRGLGEAIAQLEANLPGLMVDLGRAEDALERADRAAASAEASGNTHSLVELRAVQLQTSLARGDAPQRGDADWLVEAARTLGAADITVIALAAGADLLAIDAPATARALLIELDRAPGVRETPYYGRALPGMVRTALAVGDRDLAERLIAGIVRPFPLEGHALCSARALLAEHARDHADAAERYADAAARWKTFGHVPERARALQGQGRCLTALGSAEAMAPLREARDLFASMGYLPALRETEALLERETAHRT